MEPTTIPALASTVAIPHAPTFARLALADLRPSPDNPRRIADDDPTIAELAESLRTLGQIEPIVVRHPGAGTLIIEGEPRFEILAGERRFRAAKLAGLETIEAKVLEIDDATALEITVVENLQREDLHPLDEARGVRSLLNSGRSIDQIADRLGKRPAWVAQRAQLTALIEEWVALAAKRAELSVAHLEQVARLPEAVQRDFAAEVKDCYWVTERTAKEFGQHIAEKYLHALKAAAWKLDDADLVPEAGACSTCPKRSSCQELLFADVVGKHDRCLDAACWYRKAQAQTAVQAKRAAESGAKVLVLTERRDGNPAPAKAALPATAIVTEKTWAIRDAKKSEAGAVAAIDADTGRQSWVVVTPNADPELRKAFGVKDGRGVSSAGDREANAAVEAKRREAKRFKFRFAAIANRLHEMPEPDLDNLLRMVLVFLIDHADLSHDADAWKQATATTTAKESTADLWGHLRDRLAGIEGGQVLSSCLPDAKAVAMFEAWCGLKPQAQQALALVEFPEPVKRTAKAVKAKAVKVAKRAAKPAKSKKVSEAKKAG